jgi:AcrR family transcriptional regulator
MEDRRRDANARDDPQGRLETAVLREAGRVGYRALTVELVLERADLGRTLFYRHFANKDACYARAHAAELDRLAAHLLAGCAVGEEWQDGLETALGVLGDYVVTDPELANGVLAQVRLAGAPALAKRDAVKDRLVAALDTARATAGPEHDPPPLAGEFVYAAIEEAAVDVLSRRAAAEFSAAIPDLLFIAVAVYFGAAVAHRALGEDGSVPD